MSRVERLHREKVTRYSIRKYSFGAASVAVAALFMFLGNGAVSANELSKQETSLAAPGLASEHEGPQEAESASVVAPASDAPLTPAAQPVVEEPAKPAAPEVTTPALDKKQLENYISEVKSKLSAGTYANKTEASLALLNGELASAESTLASATTQDELTKAYQKLVTFVSSGLKNKPKDSKDAPKVDTTNGQPTVGKKAENTVPKSESNSIENTGSNDPRNGKALDKDNAFRAETTETKGDISYTLEYSNQSKKEIYLYNEENADVSISVNSTAGNIVKAYVKGGSGQYLDGRPIGSEPNQEETDGWGWTYHSVLTETPGPAIVTITGKPNERFKALPAYTKQESQDAGLGARFMQIYDAAGGKIEAGAGTNGDGYFRLVVKSQTYKYSIQQPENNANKIGVSDINNLTETDIQKIKDQIKIGYSTTSQDARLESKKGQDLDNQASVVKSIDVNGQTITVTYNDDSTDTASISDVARTNNAPTVEIPFSDAATKQVYVYGGEENSFDIKFKDDSGKIKSAAVVQGGNNAFNKVEGEENKVDVEWGYTANFIDAETTATEDSPAIISYSGMPGGKLTNKQLETARTKGLVLGKRYATAADLDNAIIKNTARGNSFQTDPGAFEVVLKPQTQKYDIQTPAEADKVAVDDASDVSEAEFNKIKDKIKIEYSKNNIDARLADKKGQTVENQADRIASIKKVDNNLVVTYKDGSTDTRPLTDFARTNNAPEVTIPYSVDGKKDVYVYANEDFDIPVKFTDDSGKVASATIKRGGNVEQPAKDAANPNVLDNEYESTVEKISTETTATEANPAVVHIKGNYSKATPGLAANKFPTDENGEFPIVTRYATATDTDGKDISNTATGSSYATDPGSFRIVLKAQTKKYDIRELADADKTVVTDITNIPQAELAKLKESLPLEYSKKNEDKNLEDKKGKAVEAENAKKVVKDLVQDGENLVVTYQDGSKDTIPVDKVVKLDKQPAIDAVTNKATDQIAAINGNDNLSQAEKDKAIADVEKDKAAALEKIGDATNSTAITTAQTDGTDAVAKVNPIGKEKAKEEIAKTLEAKKEAIENNDSLTQAEKEKAKKDAEDKATAALAEIEKQPATAETAAAATAAQQAVNDKQAEGTKEVAKINPIGKQAALDKIDEALKAKEAEMDARTDLTEEEKAEAKAEAKKLADAKKAEINTKNDNAETPEAAAQEQGKIDTAGDTGKTEVEGVKKPAAKKPEAKTAVETTAAAKKQEIEQGGALSPESKKKLQAEVDAVKEASEAAINGAKKNADVDKAKKSAEAAIKAINSARLPANKVIAKNPTALDDKEQAELKKAIEAVNPPGTKVVVSPDGSALVTLPGKTVAEPLKQEDLTKDVNALDTAGGGNDINRPTDKVIVANPESLTDADKENIKKAVREVNPNAVVTIDDNGTVTVSTPEGNTAGFTAKELVRTLADAGKDGSGNAGILKPADKKVGLATDPAAQAEVTEKLKKLNGGDEKVKAVKYDDEGNATVVLKDGTIATIPAGDLFKTEEDAKKANGGDDINKPNAQTVVEDIAALQGDKLQEVKDAIKAKVEAVNPGAVVVVDDQGNAVVTTPAGKTAVIDADDLIKKPNETSTAKAGNNINNPADRVRVDNSKQLTDPELARIKAAVEAVNPDATVVVDDNGNATVTTKDGKTATIPVADLVKSDADKENVNGGNQVNTPADRVVVDSTDAPLPQEVTDAIKAKIQAVNPDATVVVDEKGNATVTTKDGAVATIPASDLVKAKADLADPAKQDAVNKPADKVVVDPALVAADKDLPTEAKDAIKAAVEAVNPDSTVVVDDKGNATVTTPAGKTVVIPKADLVKKEADKETAKAGNNINKPVDKIVANKDALTPENIEAIKAKVQAVNPGATVVVDDKGNATVVTPDGQTATIPVTDLVKSPEEAKDEKAGNNVNKPADKVAATKADLADDAKKADVKAKIKVAVEAVNPEGSKVFVDDQGNATVTTPDGKTATIPVEDLIKDTTQPNAGNKVNTPATKVVVTDPANIKADEDKIRAEILKVNPGATVAFDEKGNATVTTKDGAVATIPASDLAKDAADLRNPDKQDAVNKPADKTLVKKVGKLTPAEKDAIKAEIAKVSRDPKTTIVVDDEGNATITTEDGRSFVIPAKDLVKTAEEAKNAKAGNNINKPADKVVVEDPTKPLSPEEKKAIEAKIKEVNPDAKAIFVDDKGNATVTIEDKDGNTETATIPAADLVTSPEEAKQPNAGNKVNTPADKVVVSDPDHLSDEDKAKITEAIKAVNPEAKVAFDDKGNATVTTKDGDIATIPAADLVKTAEEAAKPNAGNNVNTPADKTVVADPNSLTDDEKKAIAAKVAAVNPGATVAVDDKGNATVTVNGKTAVIPAAALTKTADSAKEPNAGNDVVKPADKTVVEDPESLTKDEQDAIAAKVKSVNPEAKTVVVDDQGNATVTTKDGKAVVIPAKDLVKTAAEAAKPNTGNDVNTPADKTVLDPNDLEASKKAIEDKVKSVNPGATVVVDDKGNATVTTKDGKVAVIPASDLTKTADSAKEPNAGNDVIKPADKTVVANPDLLTKDEKDAIVAKVKAVNPDATVVVDDQGNATVTPKDGKPVVIPASDLIKTASDAAKPNAGNDIVKPADKTVVTNPNALTPKEKAAIAAKVTAVNPGAEVVVDDQGNATVTTPEGKTAVIPAADLTKSSDAEKAPNAGNDIVKPASKTKVANPDSLTKDEKDAIAAKVVAVNPGSTVVVDDQGNATVTLPNGNTAVIPASDLTKSEKDVNDGKAKDNAVTPASKTKVANPNALTEAEKKAIADKVKAANPGATVVVDDKGNATVVKDGNVSVIPSTDLVKVEDDATKPNGGNDANTPAAKTVVADSTKLTDKEKEAVKKAVEAVNPGSTVVVDDKGNATVTKGDGTVLNIPASDLVIPAEKFADEAKTAKVKTPAIRTLVGNKENLTKDEKDAVKKSIEAVNPGATVVVDDKGNATVTMPDGSTATISKEQLVKDKEAVSKSKHGGDNLDIDLSKVEVADLANITPEEKAKFQFKVLGAITNVEEFDLDAYIKSTDKDGNTVYTSKDAKVKITIDKDGNATVEKDGKKEVAVNIDKAGNVTIVTKEGQVLAIPRDDAFKQRPYVPLNGGGNNGATNTDAKADKAKLEGAIHQLDELFIQESSKLDAETAKEATDLLADAKKVFADPKASQDEVDAMVKRIEDFMAKVAPSTDPTSPAKDQAAQTSDVAPATAQAANANQAAANARKAAKELPNTGTADSTVAMVAAAASALLGLGLAGRRRKEDEEA